jgi:hypothetical protein
LLAEGIQSRVVSMPSWDIFDHQPQDYRDSVLPPGVRARVAVEQASTFGWERYTGLDGRIIGMKTFGASAPLKELQKKVRVQPGARGRGSKGVAASEYRPTEAARSGIEDVMRGLCENRGEHFGNARVVLNLFEQVQQEHANRLSSIAEPTRDELLTIEVADLERAVIPIQPQR